MSQDPHNFTEHMGGFQLNGHDFNLQQDSINSTAQMHPDDLLDEFLDTRIYDTIQNNNNAGGKHDSELNHPVSTTSTNVTKDSSAEPADLIHSILSRNYLHESNRIPGTTDEDYLFKINSSNDSNNSIIPPETPPNDDQHMSSYAQPQLDSTLQDMDIDYNFNDFYDLSKVTDIQSEEFRQYEESRKELMKLKFGVPAESAGSTMLNTTIPSYVKLEDNESSQLPSLQVPDDYYDTSKDDDLPYKMTVSDLPDHSRVETQIKINLSISPAPPQFLLRLPSDTISKSKLRLQEEVPEESKKHMLWLDTYVMTSGESTGSSGKKKSAANSPESEGSSPINGSNNTSSSFDSTDNIKLQRDMKSCNICTRCIRRELKRASRRKKGALEDGLNWTFMGPKRAVIFNCKEVISFPPPTVIAQAQQDQQQQPKEQSDELSAPQDGKSIEISSRIICYCRHHSESRGFRLFFVLKDHEGKILAKTFSTPIMIMDRKKAAPSDKLASGAESGLKKDQPLSPTSLDDDSSEAFTGVSDSSRPAKRRRGFSPPASAGGCSSTYCDSVSQQRSFSVASSHNNSISLKKEVPSPSYSSSEHQRSPNIFNNNTTPERNESITSVTSSSSAALSKPSVSVPPVMSIASPPSNKPVIQRIIPAQGPIRGGIEVTLLGTNFHPGLTVKFGANQALTTHCWSDSTIVTYLPPASTAGQVLVTFENKNGTGNSANKNSNSAQAPPHQVFTYTDDTDRQLIELALQIVGLKMNGKLEDAKHIAKRIIGNSNDNSNAVSPSTESSNNNSNTRTQNMADSICDEWMFKATETVKELSNSSSTSEEVLLKFLSLLDLPNAPIMAPNWAICTLEGQTLLHLAAMKNYYYLVLFLIKRGSRVDYRDANDFTPLHLAFMSGNREIIEVFIKCGASLNNKIGHNVTLETISNSNVLDLIPQEMAGTTVGSVISHTRRSSNDSISSMFNDFDDSLRQHVSKMVEGSLTPVDFENDACYNSESISGEQDSLGEVDDDEFADESDYDAESYDDGDDDDDRTEVGREPVVEEVDELPDYDELFPSSVSLKSLIKSMTGSGSKSTTTGTSASTSTSNSAEGSSVEVVENLTTTSTSTNVSEDKLFKFFINNSTRTTPIRRDVMLFLFWLPLLLITMAVVWGFNSKPFFEEQLSNLNEFLRLSLANFMLGRERVGGMINSVNAAVTAGLNNMSR